MILFLRCLSRKSSMCFTQLDKANVKDFGHQYHNHMPYFILFLDGVRINYHLKSFKDC